MQPQSHPICHLTLRLECIHYQNPSCKSAGRQGLAFGLGCGFPVHTLLFVTKDTPRQRPGVTPTFDPHARAAMLPLRRISAHCSRAGSRRCSRLSMSPTAHESGADPLQSPKRPIDASWPRVYAVPRSRFRAIAGSAAHRCAVTLARVVDLRLCWREVRVQRQVVPPTRIIIVGYRVPMQCHRQPVFCRSCHPHFDANIQAGRSVKRGSRRGSGYRIGVAVLDCSLPTHCPCGEISCPAAV